MDRLSRLGRARRRSETWLTRCFMPREHAAEEMVLDYLLPLYGVEHDLTSGRFHTHSTEPMSYHSTVDLTALTQEDARRHFLECMLEWLAGTGHKWGMQPLLQADLALLVSFEDAETACAFDILYGGPA